MTVTLEHREGYGPGDRLTYFVSSKEPLTFEELNDWVENRYPSAGYGASVIRIDDDKRFATIQTWASCD